MVTMDFDGKNKWFGMILPIVKLWTFLVRQVRRCILEEGQMFPSFVVVGLGRQEELSGPPQHATIRINRSGNSPDDSRPFGRL